MCVCVCVCVCAGAGCVSMCACVCRLLVVTLRANVAFNIYRQHISDDGSGHGCFCNVPDCQSSHQWLHHTVPSMHQRNHRIQLPHTKRTLFNNSIMVTYMGYAAIT